MEKEITLNRLEKSQGSEEVYTFTNKRDFSNFGHLKKEYITQSRNFAYEMSFTTKGHHRKKRSGGKDERKNNQIFCDAFNGKLGEFAIYQYFNEQGIPWPEPDLTIMGKGRWDSFDYELKSEEEVKLIAVKTTKKYGQLLLLEKKDWGIEGEYLPNPEKTKYDHFILVRIDSKIIGELKGQKLYYKDSIEDEILDEVIWQSTYEFDIAGIANNSLFKQAIEKSHIINQGDFLQSKDTEMDATNYYIQAGDMYSVELYTRFLKKFFKLKE